MDEDRERRIRERAYFLWKKEGGPEGQDKVYWERAELLEAEEGEPPMATPLSEGLAEDPGLEEGLKETFPASDPPSFTPATKTRANKKR